MKAEGGGRDLGIIIVPFLGQRVTVIWTTPGLLSQVNIVVGGIFPCGGNNSQNDQPTISIPEI